MSARTKPTVLLAALAMAACAGNSGYQPPSRAADIVGFVTQWNETGEAASVLVEENPELDQGGRKIWLRMTDETQLLRWNDDAGGYGTIAREDLAEGLRVRAWSTGAVAESYPEQGVAHTIVLLD